MQKMQKLIDEAKSVFAKKFATEAKWLVAAPGRVNLIGEHTDYNEGFVLPMAIERFTVIAAAPKTGKTATIYSVYMEDEAEICLDESARPKDKVTWDEYVQGTIFCCRNLGFSAMSFNAVIVSNVPLGSGLSSSASLEVATATLLENMLSRKMSPVEKALACQAAEHQFAKMPCGIMDQFISVFGKEGHAMLLDCRSRVPKMISMNDPNVSVLITNSNVKHELTGSEYPERREQCEIVAKHFGVPFLRDVTPEMLESEKKNLSDLAYRRAKHVIAENKRTTDMAIALESADWHRCGQLMYQSHESMQHDFEISCPELDILVSIAKEYGEKNGVFGSRMTGGGFGGCSVSLVRTDCIDSITKHFTAEYQKKTGIEPTIFASRPAQGAQIL